MAAVLVPVIFMFVVVTHYVVNVPQWDEIEIVDLFQQHDAGTLGVSDFWRQHNEHRIFFPNVIMYNLAYLTKWNIGAEALLSFMFACGALVFLLLTVRRTIKTRSIRIAAMLFTACLLFSPMQGENWLWGWQLEWYLTVFALTGAMWSLCAWPSRFDQRWRMPAALALALVATYSLGSGPFIWIIGAAALLLRRETWRRLALWGGVAVPALALYYYGYNFHADPASKAIATQHPERFVEYVATYLGHALSWNKYSAPVFGVLFLGLVVWIACMIFRRPEFGKKIAAWAGFMIFGLLAAASTAIGRLEFGIGQALAPRYMIMASLFCIGLVVGLAAIAEELWQRKRQLLLITAGVAAATLLVAFNYIAGFKLVRDVSIHYRWIQNCAHMEQPTEWCLLNIFPDPMHAQESVDYLKAKHWGGF